MRPSSGMTFEPGLERGVPWGRDLFTFVTSAAGHMMRTLQRPRKSKPSKRQVNHRRFLHNMIQRKFAEIEAANQQLASALFSTDISKGQSRAESTQASAMDQSKISSKEANCSQENEDSKQQQGHENNLWMLGSQEDTGDTSPDISICHILNGEKNVNSGTNHVASTKNGGGRESSSKHRLHDSHDQIIDFSYETGIFSPDIDLDNLSHVSNIFLDDGVCSLLDSVERIREVSQPLDTAARCLTPLSPMVSPLSLDSCDFGIQMLSGDQCSQDQAGNVTDAQSVEGMEDLGILDSSEEGEDLLDQSDSRYTLATVWGLHVGKNLTSSQVSRTFSETLDTAHRIEKEMDFNSQMSTCQLEGQCVLEGDFLNRSCNPTENTRGNISRYQDCSGTSPQHLDNSVVSNHRDGQYVESNEDVPLCHALASEMGYFQSNNVGEWNECSNPDHTSYWVQQTGRTENVHMEHLSNPDKGETYKSNMPFELPLQRTDETFSKSHILCKGLMDPGSSISANEAYSHCMSADANCILGKIMCEDSTSVLDTFLTASPESCSKFDIMPSLSSHLQNEEICSNANTLSCQSIQPFIGVARSFPAPMPKLHLHHISTPPLDNDWLFDDIVEEEMSGFV